MAETRLYHSPNFEKPVKITPLIKLREPVDATCCFGEKRILFEQANLAVDLVTGSERWGDQIAYNLWTRKFPKFETRPLVHNGYNRVAWSLPVLTCKSFNEKLLEKLWGVI